MTKIERLQGWRRLVGALEAATLIGLPFLRIREESALRFDIPTLRLHFFGLSIWMEEFFILLIGVLFVTFLFFFITLIFGRIWCGWLCPQTVLGDVTARIEKTFGVGGTSRAIAWMFIFLLSALVAANLIWYFISPYDFFSHLLHWQLGKVARGFWIILTGIIFLNLVFLRQGFCKTVCPYAKLQGALYDDRTLIIAFDPDRREECIQCLACVKTCPVDIDIREGLSDACINCAECIDACTEIMGRKNKKSLIGYFFGIPKGSLSILRQNSVMIGSVMLVFMLFFLFLLFTRVPVDMVVLPNNTFSPRLTRDGTIVNSYILSVKNRGTSDIILRFKVAGKGADIKTIPDGLLTIKAGTIKKIPAVITIREPDRDTVTDDITISIESVGSGEINISRKATLYVPER
ncbi:MAG: 4Fe-4S binding protein [Nitrospiraceae bacterium]|nr:MAG: 4Fe-4S binding protein [Nitrospiraceae bacterium]